MPIFMKIDGVDGESRDSKHRGEIEIESFSWGQSNSGSAHTGGGMGNGKVSVQDFHFVTRTSSASPLLMQATATGRHFSKAVLTVRRAGANAVDYLKVTMTDILISSYQLGGADVPMDQVSLNFSKVEMNVLQQNPDGSLS